MWLEEFDNKEMARFRDAIQDPSELITTTLQLLSFFNKFWYVFYIILHQFLFSYVLIEREKQGTKIVNLFSHFTQFQVLQTIEYVLQKFSSRLSPCGNFKRLCLVLGENRSLPL
jgi:hypothetical protein